MCTVSYLPYGPNGFVLTSNRDEKLSRGQSEPPACFAQGDLLLTYPRDPFAKGTWICSASNGYTLVLLNGAFQAHEHQPPYRRSRGLVLLDFFQYRSPQAFAEGYDFRNIEPFTLLFVHACQALSFHELVWDGRHTHLYEHNAQSPGIWSSATLYDPLTRKRRREWFADFLSHNPSGQLSAEALSERILDFHHFGGYADHEGFLIARENTLKTISITQVRRMPEASEMRYKDLIDQSQHISELDFAPCN